MDTAGREGCAAAATISLLSGATESRRARPGQRVAGPGAARPLPPHRPPLGRAACRTAGGASAGRRCVRAHRDRPCAGPGRARQPDRAARRRVECFVTRTRTLRSCVDPPTSGAGRFPARPRTGPRRPGARRVRRRPAPLRRPEEPQELRGTSPITKASGTRRVVLTRVAVNKRLRDAPVPSSVRRVDMPPPRARVYCDAHRAAAPPSIPASRPASAGRPARQHPARLPAASHCLQRANRLAVHTEINRRPATRIKQDQKGFPV